MPVDMVIRVKPHFTFLWGPATNGTKSRESVRKSMRNIFLMAIWLRQYKKCVKALETPKAEHKIQAVLYTFSV
jgi:hypothetical protein